MNLRLPVMGGLEVARRIRQREGGKDGKIVPANASPFGFRRAEALAPSFDRLLHISFQREVLKSLARLLDVVQRCAEAPLASIAERCPLKPGLHSLRNCVINH